MPETIRDDTGEERTVCPGDLLRELQPTRFVAQGKGLATQRSQEPAWHGIRRLLGIAPHIERLIKARTLDHTGGDADGRQFVFEAAILCERGE